MEMCMLSCMYVPISDTNECKLNSSGCSQNCTNTIGSYNCSCYNGYQLNADVKHCNGKYLFILTHATTELHTATLQAHI